MKKILSGILALGAAAMLIPSCSVENPANNSEKAGKNLKTIEFRSTSLETKSYFDTDNISDSKVPVIFTGNEGGVAVSCNMYKSTKSTPNHIYADNAPTISDDGKTLTYSIEMEESDTIDTYTFYAIAPASAYANYIVDDGIEVVIPASQSSTDEYPLDESAMIMIGWNGTPRKEFPTETVDVKFHHVGAYLWMTLTGIDFTDENIKTLTISSENDNLSGTVYYSPDKEDEPGMNGFYKGNKSVTVNVEDRTVTDGSLDVWATVGTISGGTQLTFSLATDQGNLYTVTKVLTKDDEPVEDLVSGQIAKFKLDFSSATKSEEIKTVTIAEFLAAKESSTQKYQITGKITSIANSTYGNITIEDDSGSVYVYGLTATELGYGATNDKSFSSLGLKVGDTVTLVGYRYSYNGTDEVKSAYYISHVSGKSSEEETEEVKTVTVEEFLAAEESSTQPYQLTGTITEIKNSTYGNFTLKDDSGSVYVYGLTKTNLGYGATNDKSFSSIGLKVGDTVTIIGYRYSYNGTDEVKSAYYVSHVSSSGEEEDEGIPLNSSATWSSATHDTYGTGYSTTIDGVTVAYYKYNSTSAPIAASDDHIRVYKNSVIVVTAPSGKTIDNIVFTCKSTDKCANLTDPKDSTKTVGTADTTTKTITCSNVNANEFVGCASNGQVRISKMEINYTE